MAGQGNFATVPKEKSDGDLSDDEYFAKYGTWETPESRGTAPPKTAEEYQRMINMQLYQRALNQQAPQVQGTTGVQYKIDPTATRFAASQAETPAEVAAAAIDQTRKIDSRDVNAPQLGAAREVGAPHLAPSAMATANGVDAATIDKSASDQIRSRQLGYLDTLDAAASGKAPSVAETSYLAKAGDVGREALGLAAQARGSNRASARSAAVREVADQQRRMALDSAMLRAGETTAARGQLGGALTDVRGVDVGLAAKQAELTQGARTTTAELGTAVSQGNRDAMNAQSSLGAQLALKAAQGNQEAVNARAVQQGTMTQATEVGNAERQQAAQLANQQALQARAIEEARQRTLVAQGNQTIGAQLATANAGLRQGAAAAGAEAQNARTSEMAKGEYTAGIGDREATLGVATTNAGLTQQNQQMQQTGAQQAVNAASGNVQTEEERLAAERDHKLKVFGTILGGGATVGAAAAGKPSKGAG